MAWKKKDNYVRVPEDPPVGPSIIPIAILLFIWPIGTMISLILAFKRLKGEMTKKRYALYRRYANAIGSRASVDIRDLASRVGKSASEAVGDLQAMIDQGIIGGDAYIDRGAMTLHLDSNVVETEFVSPTVNVFVNNQTSQTGVVRPEQRVRPGVQEERVSPQAMRIDIEEQKKATEKSAPSEPSIRTVRAQSRKSGTDNADFEAKLKEIRRLNEEIDDVRVSERIDRIGELTSGIFRLVREKPERAEEVRKFMNYYLPTTFKLLKSYSLMEKQSYQGENIQASRKKIEDVLDTLVVAFEKQQDRLFQTEALDVETDISVLETMMASDGLLENKKLKLRTSGDH